MAKYNITIKANSDSHCNISDIYAIGYGFVTVINIYSGEYIETIRYEFTAERIK